MSRERTQPWPLWHSQPTVDVAERWYTWRCRSTMSSMTDVSSAVYGRLAYIWQWWSRGVHRGGLPSLTFSGFSKRRLQARHSWRSREVKTAKSDKPVDFWWPRDVFDDGQASSPDDNEKSKVVKRAKVEVQARRSRLLITGVHAQHREVTEKWRVLKPLKRSFRLEAVRLLITEVNAGPRMAPRSEKC